MKSYETRMHETKNDLKAESLQSFSKQKDDFDEDSVEYLVNEFILTICQILCFPFAIDANEEVISRIYKIIKEFNLFSKIISSCISSELTYHCDIPISLISRLVLTGEDLVQLMIDQLNQSSQLCDFLTKLLYQNESSDSLIADIFSILGHLSRKSEDVTATVIKILKGASGNFQIVIKCLNGNPMVKARCCNMLGNIMKHNDCFYDVLKKNKSIFENLVRCCQTDELNARKVNFLILC